MPIQDLLLIFTAGISFTVGFFIGIRDRHNASNVMYFILTLCMSVWAISLLLFRAYHGDVLSEFFGRFSYVAGLCMVTSFCLFTLHFPYKESEIHRVTKFFLLFIVAIVSVIVLGTNLLVSGVTVVDNVVSMVTNPLMHGFYAFLLLFFIVLGLINLLHKMKSSTGSHQRQVASIFFAALIAAFFGLFFDVALPIIGDYRWNWLGPQFLILFAIAVGMIIIVPKLRPHD
jgi:hypothetical protein